MGSSRSCSGAVPTSAVRVKTIAFIMKSSQEDKPSTNRMCMTCKTGEKGAIRTIRKSSFHLWHHSDASRPSRVSEPCLLGFLLDTFNIKPDLNLVADDESAAI
jgi:hypothetical protein